MINIKIICVGDLKEKYLKEFEAEYAKRLSKYSKLEVIVLKDEKLPTTLNESNINIIKEKEGNAILQKLNNLQNSYIFVLDENGKEFTSVEFSKKLENLPSTGYSTICFVIGGSLGLSENVKKSAKELLSFSKFTFPHQMIRIFLEEQLFRAFKIIHGETYHH